MQQPPLGLRPALRPSLTALAFVSLTLASACGPVKVEAPAAAGRRPPDANGPSGMATATMTTDAMAMTATTPAPTPTTGGANVPPTNVTIDPPAPAPADGGAPGPSPSAPTPPPPAGPPPSLPASVAALWAVGDGDALEQDSAAAPRTSSVWDGERIKLFAARNEVVAFQLITRAGPSGISALGAALPELRQQGGEARVLYKAPALDPSESAGRPIQLHAVNYMRVDKPSNAPWIYQAGTAGAPADPTGKKPVQLVPENARPGKGGFPLAVPAGQLQALFFEIYLDRGLPAGLYQGTVTLTIDGARYPVPIELELFDFALPDDNELSVMAYYEPEQAELYQGRNLDAAYHRFAHRNRIELVHEYDQARVEAAMGRFDGSDFTTARGYGGPGEGRGQRIIPATFYGPGAGWEDRTVAWQRSDAWMTFLDARVPGAITFLYMPDEPTAADYPLIRSIAGNLKANPGPGRRLPTFVTREWVSELDGSIDTWCSHPFRYNVDRAATERGKGRDWWVYNGGRPAGPALVMDAPPTDAREIGWAAFKAGQRGYFYWHANHWRHNHQKKVGDRNQNVWSTAVTFDQRDAAGGGMFANGDGVLIYPGSERLHPEEDRGIEGPISTLTLANLRRGLQDHLYLSLARKHGLGALVDESLAAIVPKVFTAASGAVSFPQESEPYEQARLRLGRALAAKLAVPPTL